MSNRLFVPALALAATFIAGPAAASEPFRVVVQAKCHRIGEMPADLPAIGGPGSFEFPVERSCSVGDEDLAVKWEEVEGASAYSVVVIEAGPNRWHLVEVVSVLTSHVELNFRDAKPGQYAFAVVPTFHDNNGVPSAFTLVERRDDPDPDPANDGTDGSSEEPDLQVEIDELNALLDDLEAELDAAWETIDYYEALTGSQKQQIHALEASNSHLKTIIRTLQARLAQSMQDNRDLQKKLETHHE